MNRSASNLSTAAGVVTADAIKTARGRAGSDAWTAHQRDILLSVLKQNRQLKCWFLGNDGSQMMGSRILLKCREGRPPMHLIYVGYQILVRVDAHTACQPPQLLSKEQFLGCAAQRYRLLGPLDNNSLLLERICIDRAFCNTDCRAETNSMLGL